MKKSMRTLMFSTLVIGGALMLISMNNDIQDEWPVPAKYKNMKNPMAGKADTDNVGKELYIEHCQSCHGKTGLGDGKKASRLDKEMRPFNLKEVQAQLDGELYYKSIIGNDDMPNYEKKIKDETDRWLVINYIRTLNK